MFDHTVSTATRNAERGFSLLEQALVLPVFLLLILAAVDVSRVLQAYSVLDDSLRQSLRCVSAANGECISTTDDTRNVTYSVFERDAQFRYLQYEYSGEASWIGAPYLRTTSLQATILDQVHYDIPERAVTASRTRFSVAGEVGYLAQVAGLPQISGNATGPFTPQVTQRAAAGTVARPLFSQSIRGVSLALSSSGTGDDFQDSITFTIPRPAALSRIHQNEPCLVADDTQPLPSEWKHCNSLSQFGAAVREQVRDGIAAMFRERPAAREGADYTFIVLDIRGAAAVPTGESGEVEISLSQGGRIRELGGRIFNASSGGNFVPRGAPADSYSDAVRDRYSRETQRHQAIVVEYGKPITLAFTLKGAEGAPAAGVVRWDGVELNVYGPQYEFRSERAECVEPDGQALRLSSCQIGAETVCASTFHGSAIRKGSAAIGSAVGVKESLSLCAGSDVHAAVAATGASCPQDFSVEGTDANRLCSNRQQLSAACPAIGVAAAGGDVNRGVSAVAADENGQRFIRASSAAERICPVPESDREQASGLRWTERDEAIPGIEHFSWVMEDCTREEPGPGQIPAAIGQYAKVKITSVLSDAKRKKILTGGVEPNLFRSSHPRYQCTDMVIETRQLNARSPELKPESIFRSTAALGADFQERLFQDASKNHVRAEDNLESGTYFTAEERTIEVVSSRPPPVTGAPYRVDSDASGEWRKIRDQIPFEEIPAHCRGGDARCFASASGLTGEARELLPQFEKAELLAYEVLDAMMPGFQRECARDATHACVSFQVRQDALPSDRTVWMVKGEVNVPLLLSPAPFRYARVVSQEWEGDFANQ